MNKPQKLLRALLFFVISVQLVSCVATGPKFASLVSPSGNAGVVYFIRESSSAAGARAINISINNEHYAELHSGGYTYIQLAPGQYSFEQSFNVMYGDIKALRHKRMVEAEIESGKEYFVLFLASSGTGPGETVYIPVSTSPLIMLPTEISFDFRFGFAEKQAAMSLLKESRYERPTAVTAKE